MLNTDQASAIAQERYEQKMIDEARSICRGDSNKAPSVEHLRLVLYWLDGPDSSMNEEVPF